MVLLNLAQLLFDIKLNMFLKHGKNELKTNG